MYSTVYIPLGCFTFARKNFLKLYFDFMNGLKKHTEILSGDTDLLKTSDQIGIIELFATSSCQWSPHSIKLPLLFVCVQKKVE